MKVQVTITVDAPDRDTARRTVQAAGYTVTRVTVPRGKTTEASAGVLRPNALTDMPNVTGGERRAYVKGYAKGCMSYAKKHGIPKAELGDLAGLRTATAEYERDRHPAAHKAGLRELAKYEARTTQALLERAA